jgi:thiamine pyrophosphate-dependent acetolactate synthase large subunit-like protein
MHEWNALLDRIENTPHSPLRPQMVIRALSDLSPIDFVAYAKACGADGFRCAKREEIRPAIMSAFRSPKPAIIEAIVDPDEQPLKPGKVKG